MALSRNRTRINVKGGGKLYLRELSPTPSDTYLDLGYLEDSKINDDGKMTESVDELGNYIDTKSGGRTVSWETTAKQTGADEINLIKNSNGKYYELYYSVLLANGNYQMYSIPLSKIENKVELEFKAGSERKLKLKFSALAPKAAFTRGVVAFNVVKDEPYIMVEAGTETFNTSNDEASELASAIL